jgi:hypothetical protein
MIGELNKGINCRMFARQIVGFRYGHWVVAGPFGSLVGIDRRHFACSTHASEISTKTVTVEHLFSLAGKRWTAIGYR